MQHRLPEHHPIGIFADLSLLQILSQCVLWAAGRRYHLHPIDGPSVYRFKLNVKQLEIGRQGLAAIILLVDFM